MRRAFRGAREPIISYFTTGAILIECIDTLYGCETLFRYVL
ncbi:hypothetical protein CsSME_00044513 [Camellia sinensis var. sinensis]